MAVASAREDPNTERAWLKRRGEVTAETTHFLDMARFIPDAGTYAITAASGCG
jgi:hypothetical protein